MRVFQRHAGDDAKLLIKFHWPNSTKLHRVIIYDRVESNTDGISLNKVEGPQRNMCVI